MFTWKVINKVVILQTKIKLGNNLDSKVVEQWTHVDTSPIYSSFTRVNYTMTPNNPFILSPASIPTPKQETTSWPPTPQLKSSTPISTSKEVFIILPQWWDVVITLSTSKATDHIIMTVTNNYNQFQLSGCTVFTSEHKIMVYTSPLHINISR